MEEEDQIPMLLVFMFGETAMAAQRRASKRLMVWCQAFDEWLAERRRTYKPDTTKQSMLAWRRLVQQSGKMPRELNQADIEAHAAWMQEALAARRMRCKVERETTIGSGRSASSSVK